jgi:hypothetical protein
MRWIQRPSIFVYPCFLGPISASPRRESSCNPCWICGAVAIIKKQINLEASLYTLLLILSVTMFEKIPIKQALQGGQYTSDNDPEYNHLNLFDY